MTNPNDQLRVALGQLDEHELTTMITNVRQLADRQGPTRPRTAAVWSAFAAVAEDVQRLERAINRSEHHRGGAVRAAKRGRR